MKRIIALFALQSALLAASQDDTRWFMGKEGLKKGEQIANKLLNRVNNELPTTAGAAGDAFGRGVATGALDTLSPEVRKQIASDMGGAAGDAFGRGAVSGTISELGNQGTKAAQKICEHPYAISSALAGLGLVGVTYRYVRDVFPSRDESNRRARIAREQAEHKQALDTLATESEFRTCLNMHFRSMEPGQRMPRQCHSPARRLTLLDTARANGMLDALSKFND